MMQRVSVITVMIVMQGVSMVTGSRGAVPLARATRHLHVTTITTPAVTPVPPSVLIYLV